MNEYKKLIKAKVGIILDHPFFATLMMRKLFIENNSIKTARTDGKVIEYNRNYFDSLSNAEVQGVICHELLHGTLLHHLRRNGRDNDQWNVACDYALNPTLIEGGVILPKGALVDSRFSGRSAEEIFKIIAQEKKEAEQEQQSESDKAADNDEGQNEPDENEQKNGDSDEDAELDGEGDGGSDENGDAGQGGTGDVMDAPIHSESELAEAEAEAKQELAQAIQIAKQQGKLPASLARMVQEVLQPKIAWQEVLARFLSEIAHNDYSFSKPNSRYLSTGFILPSLYNVEMGDIVLMVDTSGSIDDEQLNKFAGEMQDIVSNFNSPITVLYIDAEVQGEPYIIEPDDTFKLEARGGGGTDFRPGFEWLDEHGITPKAVVYFTDGCCSSYPKEPEFPVLWAQWGGYTFNPPFGEKIEVE